MGLSWILDLKLNRKRCYIVLTQPKWHRSKTEDGSLHMFFLQSNSTIYIYITSKSFIYIYDITLYIYILNTFISLTCSVKKKEKQTPFSSMISPARNLHGCPKTLNRPSSQLEFQDPKMEVVYHIRPYFVGIFP